MLAVGVHCTWNVLIHTFTFATMEHRRKRIKSALMINHTSTRPLLHHWAPTPHRADVLGTLPTTQDHSKAFGHRAEATKRTLTSTQLVRWQILNTGSSSNNSIHIVCSSHPPPMAPLGSSIPTSLNPHWADVLGTLPTCQPITKTILMCMPFSGTALCKH